MTKRDVKLLSEVSVIGAGNPAPQTDAAFAGGTLPFFRTSDVGRIKWGTLHNAVDMLNLEAASGLRRIPKGTILFPKSGASTFLNHRVVTAVDGYASSHLATISPIDGIIDGRYLFYYLTTVRSQDLTADSKYPSLNLEAIRAIPVPVRTLQEQRRIVSVLDKTFDNIALARANTDRNIANVRELFESAMTKIVATENDDWEKGTFGDRAVLSIIDGDRGANYPKKADFKSKGYCLFLNTKNVRQDGFSWDSLMFVSKEKDSALRKGRVEPGDIVLTTRGTVGNIGLLTDDVPYAHIRINSGMVILRPNRQRILPAFLFAFLKSPFFKQQVRAAISGAAQPQLPIRTLVSLTFAFPRSIPKQQRVADTVEELSSRCRALTQTAERRLRLLDDLRQSVLRSAFNGDL